MELTEKKRTDAGEAALELRKALGYTQQEFAWHLKVAITTIARYESGNPPPRGEALLRFRDIAQAKAIEERKKGERELAAKLEELSEKFEFLHVEDRIKDLGSKLIFLPRTGDKPARGFLTMALTENALVPGEICQSLLALMNSGQKLPDDIAKAYESLKQAFRKDEDAVAKQIRAAMHSYVTGRPMAAIEAKSAKKKRKPS